MPVEELATIIAIKSDQSEGESRLRFTRGLHDPLDFLVPDRPVESPAAPDVRIG